MAYDPSYVPSGNINYTSQFQNGFTTPTQFGSGQSTQFGSGNYTMASTPQQLASYQSPQQSSSGGGSAGGVGSASPSSSGGLQAPLGAFQIIQGMQGMKQLEKEKFPEYSASAELSRAKTRSGQMANMGFTPEQRAQFNFTLGQATNQDYRNAIDLAGGNLSGALNARRSGMRLGAINQFAQQDAQQRMSNIRYDDSMTDKIQRLKDNNTQIALNRRMALEQAYGNAIKTGTENIANSFDMGQAMKMMAGGM